MYSDSLINMTDVETVSSRMRSLTFAICGLRACFSELRLCDGQTLPYRLGKGCRPTVQNRRIRANLLAGL